MITPTATYPELAKAAFDAGVMDAKGPVIPRGVQGSAGNQGSAFFPQRGIPTTIPHTAVSHVSPEVLHALESQYGKKGAAALTVFGRGEAALEAYAKRFDRYYKSGRIGLSFDQIPADLIAESPHLAKVAFDAGVRDAKETTGDSFAALVQKGYTGKITEANGSGSSIKLGMSKENPFDAPVSRSSIDGELNAGRIQSRDQLLKQTTCTSDELSQYLTKAAGADAAKADQKSGVWPDNVQIPKNSSVLKPDGSINWDKAPKSGYVLNTKGDAIREPYVPKIGEIIDCFGSHDGRFTSPVVDGKLYRYDQRSLPYLEDYSKYHQYRVTGDFSKLKDYVRNCPNLNLRSKILKYIAYYYKGNFHKAVLYRGKIASIDGWGKGGGIQYELPLRVEWLKELGYYKK